MDIDGLIGKKVGMTRIFTAKGVSIPVTVIEIKNNYVTQIKSANNGDYYFVQVTTGLKKDCCVTKSEFGYFKKIGVNVGEGLWEFKAKNIDGIFVKQSISVEFFRNIKKVDVIGFSKGKGFSGTVKRWNFSMQDATHGNSLSHRVPGSIGQNQSPGRVFKGKKMPGQLGNKRVTVQNLDVIRIDLKNNLLLVKGSIPGNIRSNVIVKVTSKFCL
ncbi:50S ribosomal protein L3 [Candidatus Westeberhardia cardiocondylae]|uniref:Large ribosomal subunit protein uL3 n=1 Tax=Candidatus Westeberhardia cardiocondylae TaxID=1594731 RepID=A0A0H5BWP9_9ENTR|nr:50S ribosomal protein L3 [Candidatus Westeberhardia cardiocondylae]